MTKVLHCCFAAVILCVPLMGHASRPVPAQVLTVIMLDNRFVPDHVTMRAGQAYTLRLENHGKDLHEFTAPKFWKAAIVRNRKLLANGGTDVVVPAGKSVNIGLMAPAKGHYGLSCADHDWDGMVGTITVE